MLTFEVVKNPEGKNKLRESKNDQVNLYQVHHLGDCLGYSLSARVAQAI